MTAHETSLPGVLILEPKVFGDARGFFLESYNERVMADLGIRERFVQDNHSFSAKNVLRGLHYQVRHSQGKLIRVTSGRVFLTSPWICGGALLPLASGGGPLCRPRTKRSCGFRPDWRMVSVCLRKLTSYTRRQTSTVQNRAHTGVERSGCEHPMGTLSASPLFCQGPARYALSAGRGIPSSKGVLDTNTRIT